jgi:hypothetical protein
MQHRMEKSIAYTLNRNPEMLLINKSVDNLIEIYKSSIYQSKSANNYRISTLNKAILNKASVTIT